MPVIPFIIVPASGSDQADEWMRLGFESQTNNNLPLAQQRYNQALRLDPRHFLAMNNLAVVFAQTPGLLNEGLLTIERAAMCNDKHNVIYTNWALMAMDSDRMDVALEKAQKAVELAPDDPNSLTALAMITTAVGNADEGIKIYNRLLDKHPNCKPADSNACFVQTLSDCGPKELLEQRQRWVLANKFEGTIEPHKNSTSIDRPLRVGYVGGDFKQHSAAFIFSKVLWHHSKDIDMYLYSSLPVDPVTDIKTKKFQDIAGKNWRDISALNDEAACALIRKDKIDILVDLAAHTNGGRLPIFLRKPAPVQVTGWGFAHGTGIKEIDYFFADPVAVPEEERQHYAEKIWDLPCIITFEEPTEYTLKETSMLPLKKNGYITYGCYARYEKLSDECLKAFADILRKVPDSRLEFKDHAFRRPYSIKRVMSVMEGIEPERLLFSLATNHADHMLSYQMCDIFLNPWPHSSGVVTVECLYMGVPMVTMYGKQAAGRSAASVLTAMGQPLWIAKTPQEYVDIAVKMSEDQKPLAEIRKTLRSQLLSSPVYAGYVEAVESAYKGMFKKWCDDQG